MVLIPSHQNQNNKMKANFLQYLNMFVCVGSDLKNTKFGQRLAFISCVEASRRKNIDSNFSDVTFNQNYLV